MNSLILIALINGACIGLSRSLNGQLSLGKGPFKASLYNHLVGFFILTLMLLSLPNGLSNPISNWSLESWPLYLGGLIGALYVALNSYVLNKLGAMKAALLVISGQMVTGILLDALLTQGASKALPLVMQSFGVGFILLGIVLLQRKKEAELSALKHK